MADIFGWQDPFTKENYKQGDPRLTGRGCPPTCPLKGGAGTIPMVPVKLDEADPTWSDPANGRRVEGDNESRRKFNQGRP